MPLRPIAALLVLGSLSGIPSRAGASSWARIDKADLELSKPRVNPDADAEALFWEITVWDTGDRASLRSSVTEYIRIKIFNDRGRDSQSNINIPRLNDAMLEDVSARTIRPDGSIVEVKKDAYFDRTIWKGFGVKVRARSFAFPSVEPGSIIEYRYTYTQYGRLTNYFPLLLQRDIPVRTIRLRVSPLAFPNGDYAMRIRNFNIGVPQPVAAKDGFLESTLTDVPAVGEEPYMPPGRQIKGWALFYYAPTEEPAPEKFWKDVGTASCQRVGLKKKATGALKQAARSVAGDAPVPGQGLERLYEFCRTKIRNIDDDASGLTESEREDIPENKSPEETLKRGRGTSWDINELFAAMAVALGADAHIALLADRSETFFSRDQMMPEDLTGDCVAVRDSGGWAFYDPGATYAPCGTLPWWKEGEDALITDETSPSFAATPLCGAEASLTRRTATLRLSEDGTVEGDARVELWGQAGLDLKEKYDDVSVAKREEVFRDEVRGRLGSVEVTRIELAHVQDSTLPVVASYHVVAHEFAQKVGTRLLLNPAFFEVGRQAYFPAQARRYPIYFSYPWSERDSVTIQLPAGLEVEAGDQPELAEVPNVARRESTIRVSLTSDAISYVRSMTFGRQGNILFPPRIYPILKGFFDRVHEADGHAVSLRSRGGRP